MAELTDPMLLAQMETQQTGSSTDPRLVAVNPGGCAPPVYVKEKTEMYGQPKMDDPVDRLAHYLSEVHNDSAPIGWERYRFLAGALLRKFDIEDAVMQADFLK